MGRCGCFGRRPRGRPRNVTVVLLGIDNAGKSTVLAALQRDLISLQLVTPTVGFSAETLREGSHSVRIYDLGGAADFRGIWGRYFAEVHGAIFVVDGSDEARIDGAAKTAVCDALEDPRLRGKPAVLLVNKQDIPGAIDPQSAAIRLGVPPAMPVFGCVARAEQVEAIDERLRAALRSLLERIDEHWDALVVRISALVAEQKQRDDEERIERARRLEELRALAREKEQQQQQQKEESPQRGKDPDAIEGEVVEVEAPYQLPGGVPDDSDADMSSLDATQPSSARKTPRRWRPVEPVVESETEQDASSTTLTATSSTTTTAVPSLTSLLGTAVPSATELPGAVDSETPVRVGTPPRRLAPLARRTSLPIAAVE